MTQEDEIRFLTIFCSDPEGYRPTLSKPFLQDGHVIATDTTILIKIREDLLIGKYEVNERAPDVSKVWPETFLPVITITREELFDALQKSEVRKEKNHIPLLAPCPECHGDGKVNWNYYDRNDKHHSMSFDCPICEGEGYTPNGSDIAVGIYDNSFVANPLIKVLYAMKALEVDYVTFSPPSGYRAAQLNLKEGIDIIIMPQSHIKPNCWIKKKGKKR